MLTLTIIGMTVYAFSSFFSFAITLVVLIRLILDNDRSRKTKSFIASVISTAVLMVLFGLADLLEEFKDTPIPYIMFLLIIIGSCFTLYQRCMYSFEVIGYKGPDAKYIKFGLMILYFGVAAFALVAVASSGFSDNIVFSITNGNFKAERFWYIVYGIFFSPAIVMAIFSLFAATKKENYAIKGDCIYVAIYLLGAVLPVIYTSPIDITSLFGAFFTVVYYTGNLRSKVTMDELTHISNRTLMIKKLNATVGMKNYYFFTVHAEDFKHINEAFGYAAGDAALIRVADTLKTIAPRNIMVGRLNGGHFAMLGELPSEQDATNLCHAIYQDLKRKNGKEKDEWKVNVSIGFTTCDKEELKTVPDIIKAASKSLEENKARHVGMN